jgi:hypothetical protein
VQDPNAELSVYIVIFSLIEIIRSILFLFNSREEGKERERERAPINFQTNLGDV